MIFVTHSALCEPPSLQRLTAQLEDCVMEAIETPSMEAIETSCVKGDVLQKGVCKCRKCRLSSESEASSEAEDGRRAEYAKRFPGVERKRRKSVDKYNRGDTVLQDLEAGWNKMAQGLLGAWQDWVNPFAANVEPDADHPVGAQPARN